MALALVSAALLSVHLLLANLAAGGPLVAAWLLRRGDAEVRRLGRRVAIASLTSLTLSVALGAGQLLIVWERLSPAIGRFPAATWRDAALELLFSAACGAGLVYASPRQPPPRRIVGLLAVVSSTNLLYHFPPLMIVASFLSTRPEWCVESPIDRRALLRLAFRGETLALWLHFTLASLAVAAVWALAVRRRDESSEQDPALAAARSRLAWAALVVTLLQAPVGLWILAVSPAPVRDSLFGASLVASGCFLAGVVAVLQMLRSLLAVALGETQLPARRSAAIWTAATVVAMATALAMSRPQTLAPRGANGRLSDGGSHFSSPASFSSSFGSFMTSSSVPPGSFESAINSP